MIYFLLLLYPLTVDSNNTYELIRVACVGLLYKRALQRSQMFENGMVFFSFRKQTLAKT